MNKSEYKDIVLPFVKDWKVYITQKYYDDFPDENSIKSKVENVGSLYEAFSDVINYGFYYSFNTKVYKKYEDRTCSIEVEHSHAHSFEEVLRNIYDNPESFSIDKCDYELYSKQELLYLHRLQSFLLVAGLKDTNYLDETAKLKRAKNERAKDLLQYRQVTFKNAHKIINGELTKLVCSFINDKYLKTEKYLVVDKEGNYLGIVKVEKEKVRFSELEKYHIDYKLMGYQSLNSYKDYLYTKLNLTDDSYVVIESYEIYEKF